MKDIKKLLFPGGRLLKTGLSVLITAWICFLLNLPPVFSVIAAIVTIEPTASDSIKKGIIRFPASAIGAAVSLTSTALLGDTALTYSISAVLTIFLCHKLKLDEGILVATLTAVAMIPTIHDHYLLAFLTRLGTTSIGLVVSTIVNILIIPPNYNPFILQQINKLYELAATVLEHTMAEILNPISTSSSKLSVIYYKKLTKVLEKTYQLSSFQRDEFKYHRKKTKDIRSFHYAQKHINSLQSITFHLGNLQHANSIHTEFTERQKVTLRKTTTSLTEILKNPDHIICNNHYQYIKDLDYQFWHWKDEPHEHLPTKYHHHFAPQTVVIYELLSLHDLLEEIEELTNRKKKKP